LAAPYGRPFSFQNDELYPTEGTLHHNTIYDVIGEFKHVEVDPALIIKSNNFVTEDMINDDDGASVGPTDIPSSDVRFVDPDLRDMAKYNAYLGGPRDRDAFMDEALKQWRNYYRPEYTAPALNDWIREGFTPTGENQSHCGVGAVPCGGIPQDICDDGDCTGSEDHLNCPEDCDAPSTDTTAPLVTSLTLNSI